MNFWRGKMDFLNLRVEKWTDFVYTRDLKFRV